MNLPGTTFSPVGLRGPEDPVMATFLATPEGRKLLEEAAQIERTQMGMPPAAPPATAPVAPATADPANPAPTTAANPFAALLGGDGDVLSSLLGTAPPRQTPKMDVWDWLAHVGPALMQAGSRPGASFLGSVGEGLGAGLKAAQGARRDAMTAEQQDRLYNLQRAKLGVELAQTMKKSEKAPTVQEFYDEKTGLPYKAQYDAKTDSWRRVGGVKTGDDKGVKTQLVPIRQPDGSVQQTLVDMRTGEPIKTIGAPDPRPDGKTAVVNVQQPDGSVQQVLLDMQTGQTIQNLGAPKPRADGKLPEGFRYVDPANPAKGVELIPGYQQGKAALAAPQRLPEGYQPIDPNDPSKGMRLIPGYLEGKRQVADVLSKPPEGFTWIDPANPASGVKPLPGYAEGKAQQEAMKPFTLPENATRVAPTGAGTPSPYAQNTKAFENPTGNPAARNPNSTATGDGQFLEGTWRDLWPRIAQDAAPILMKKGIDPARLTPQQILALRTDPEISAVAIDTYANANRPALRQALGREPDAGELQTAHMFGPGGAAQILTAPPQTPIQQIVSPEVYAANERFLAGKTAGDVVNHFRQRQGRGQGVAGQPVQVASAESAPLPAGRQNQPQVGPGYQIIAQGARVPKVDNAYDQTEGKNLAEERQGIADDAKVGRQTLPLVDILGTLFDQVGTGKTVPMTTTLKGWAKSLGVDLPALGITDNVGSAEAASALTREVSLKFIQQTKGSVSNAEMQIFAAMVPNIANTPEGNTILLNAMRAVAKRQIEIEKAARQYESQRGGRIDRGFADIKGEIFARHPLFPPGLAEQATRAPAPGPGPAPPPRGLTPQPAPTSAPASAPQAAPSAGPAPRGAAKSLAPQIRLMDMQTLQQLVPEALSPEDRKAAADRWEELNRGAR